MRSDRGRIFSSALPLELASHFQNCATFLPWFSGNIYRTQLW